MKSSIYRDNEVAGCPIPPKCEIIEIRLSELRQIFNRMDPSPFQEKDLASQGGRIHRGLGAGSLPQCAARIVGTSRSYRGFA